MPSGFTLLVAARRPTPESMLLAALPVLRSWLQELFQVACCRTSINGLSVAMLVLLRITVGWHFFYAGIDKLTSPNFTATGFLGQAKGPLADQFHDLIPDWDGRSKFGAIEVKIGDKVDDAARREKARTKTFETLGAPWGNYVQAFMKHYQLNKEQEAAVQKSFERRQATLQSWIEENQQPIEDYFHELHRLEAARKQKDAMVPFQQKRNWDAQTKLRGQLAGWSSQLDQLAVELQQDLRAVLTDAQVKRGPIPEPVSEMFTQDKIVVYSNLAIGMCLMVGLFTRLAAFGGALFLLPVVLAQPDWPGLYPPPPPAAGRTFIVSKEFVEMMVCAALATLPVGRWAGLDFLIYHLLVRPVYGKRNVS